MPRKNGRKEANKIIKKKNFNRLFKNKTFIDSFNNSINGLKYAIGNERNFRFHIVATMIVIFTSLFMDFTALEVLILSVTITLVIFAELINTVSELIVDAWIKVYNPKAKIIKDVAAAGVLVCTINALVVGYVLFVDRLDSEIGLVIDRLQDYPSYIMLIVIILTIFVVISLKLLYNKGTPFKGGMPSGHSAISFAITTSVALWSRDVLLVLLCLALSVLVAQSRIEGKIHTKLEVVVGAIVGIMVTLLVFSIVDYSF